MRLNHFLISGACLILPMTTIADTDTTLSEQGISAAIIGGEPTMLNQLPFFARLVLYKTGANEFANICGGSIVNDRYILTAAHCVESEVFTDGWSTDDLRVLVKNPTMDDVYVSEFKDVRRITIHPDYDASTLWINDLALLELSRPITDNVQSITLPQDFGDYSDEAVYQIFGLGQTSTTDTSGANYLRWAEIEPLTDVECAALVSGFNAQETLCANGFEDREYTGICRGDSGGPLTYVDSNGRYQQIGIVSYGSSICESPAIPSVFTEILNYTTWIELHTSDGVKTSYDAELAATEDYHSEGDPQIFEEDDNDDANSEDGGSSGSVGAGFLLIGGWLGWMRRRHFSNKQLVK
ncbi:serine protease [Vibrio sp. EA2]|uniref:S1 family peptidase n=1 Tax=Vibrio sp. EA2 TaxID=3079860 RepID=UPI002949F1CE|nr:serine protease [Vibrio sp. EA2]MDV6252044.1 serine protease [Vibrio sp. EA2]